MDACITNNYIFFNCCNGCSILGVSKPLQDWKDLWRPELSGKISMIDSPREVIGAVLKYMGSSYNTLDIESQVPGGKNAAYQNLAILQRQVLTSKQFFHPA